MIECSEMNWKKYWRNCSVDSEKGLHALMKFAGWGDEGTRLYVTEEQWYEFNEQLKQKLNIQSDDSIFEVGCGSGALLFPFYQSGHDIGGLDICSNFIAVAKEHMPDGDFIVQDAENLQIEPEYDYVLSMSTLFYLPDLTSVENVIKRMLKKARKGIAVLDLNDLEKMSEYIAAIGKNRKGTYFYMRNRSKEEEEFCDKAIRLCFERYWFYGIGEKLNCKVRVEDQVLPTFLGQFRFNVLMTKN